MPFLWHVDLIAFGIGHSFGRVEFPRNLNVSKVCDTGHSKLGISFCAT